MKAFFNYTLFLFFGCMSLCCSAQQQYADSLERLSKKKTGTEKIRLLNDLTFHYFQRDAKRAIGYGTEALALARKQPDKQLLASTLNDLSMPYMTEGNFRKVIQLNEEALSLRLQLKDSMGMFSSYAKLGVAYEELTQYDKAIANNTKALALAQKLGAELQELQILINLGNLLQSSGLYKEAYSMHLSAVKRADQLKDLPSRITARGNLASVCITLKKYKESKRYYSEAIPLIKESGQNEYFGMVYQGLGVTERALHNDQAGLDYYKKAFRVYKGMNGNVYAGVVAVNIGMVYAEQRQLDSAAFYFNIGLSESMRSKSYRQIVNAYTGLSKLERERGNYKLALDFLERSIDYKDSVQLFQGNTAISEMYAKYETANKERELAKSKLKNAEKDKQIAKAQLRISNERQSRLIWSGVAILILLTAGFFLRNLYLKRKAAIEEVKLTKKNEQLRRERELNQQKLDISRELHDNIGSQLTYMISSMDNLTHTNSESAAITSNIKDLSDFGRGTMQELRSTIWAMNAEDGSVALLFRKLEELRSKIPLELVLTNTIDGNVPLKAIEMLNLYRIGQEVIQNCLKYAGATVLSITCSSDGDSGILLQFADNGNGFDTQALSEGNGLANMRYRCEQLGGAFGINSEKGRGTTVSCALRHLTY